MSHRVSSRHAIEQRLTFVNGWLTGGTDPADGSVECGEGTAYPVLVTLREMMEIFFAVKDASFISGSGAAYFDPAIGTSGETVFVKSPQGSPGVLASGQLTEANSIAVTARKYYIRGYAARSNEHDNVYFSTPYTLASGEEAMDVKPYDVDPAISAAEVMQWIGWNSKDRDSLSGSALGLTFGTQYVCGFSYAANHEANGDDGAAVKTTSYFHAHAGLTPPLDPLVDYPDPYPTDVDQGAFAMVQLTGEIAVVRADPDDDVFAPTNTFYVGLKFQVSSQNYLAGGIYISTLKSDFTTPIEICDYIMVLDPGNPSSSNNVCCPVYIEDYGTDHRGNDFYHVAIETWPYA